MDEISKVNVKPQVISLGSSNPLSTGSFPHTCTMQATKTTSATIDKQTHTEFGNYLETIANELSSLDFPFADLSSPPKICEKCLLREQASAKNFTNLNILREHIATIRTAIQRLKTTEARSKARMEIYGGCMSNVSTPVESDNGGN